MFNFWGGIGTDTEGFVRVTNEKYWPADMVFGQTLQKTLQKNSSTNPTKRTKREKPTKRKKWIKYRL